MSEKINKDKKNNGRCKIVKLGYNVTFEIFMKYLWNTSKHELTKVLWYIRYEIWSATWAFLVWIYFYSLRVMYLLS